MPERVTKSKSIVGIKRNDKIKDKVKPNKLRKVDNSKIIASEKIESKTDNKVLNGSSVEKRTGKVYIGYHASSAGGVHNAIIDTVDIGAKCLAHGLPSL